MFGLRIDVLQGHVKEDLLRAVLSTEATVHGLRVSGGGVCHVYSAWWTLVIEVGRVGSSGDEGKA